jgi:hypothetical protein
MSVQKQRVSVNPDTRQKKRKCHRRQQNKQQTRTYKIQGYRLKFERMRKSEDRRRRMDGSEVPELMSGSLKNKKPFGLRNFKFGILGTRTPQSSQQLITANCYSNCFLFCSLLLGS